MKIHPDVAAAHAQFGGDLETMQIAYDAPAKDAQIASLQQQLADCKSSLREAQSARDRAGFFETVPECIDYLVASLKAAESRVKQVRAKTFRSAAEFAERDTDWSAFARQSKPDWKTGEETNVFSAPRTPDDTMPTDANVFAYRIGIATGRAIAAGLRALASKEGGK